MNCDEWMAKMGIVNPAAIHLVRLGWNGGQEAMRERAAEVCRVMSPWDECLENAEDAIRALPVE